MKKYLSLFLIIFIGFFAYSCSNDEQVDLSDQVKGFSSYEELNDYISENTETYDNYYYDGVPEVGDTRNDMEDAVGTETEKNFSETNIQVEGVKESDSIITDGYYIYIAKNQQFQIVDANDLSIVYQETFENDNIFGMYILQDKIVLLKNTYYPVVNDETTEITEPTDDYFYFRYINNFSVLIYDKTDINNIELERKVEFERSYLVDSRMIDDNLFLILNENGFKYTIEGVQQEDYIPSYLDTISSDAFIDVPYSDIYYFSENDVVSNYLILASFSVNSEEEVSISAYLGSSFEVYMSENNLYVSAHKYIYIDETDFNSLEYKTNIMRFEIVDNELVFRASTNIDGITLNQFSFDEYEGVLRVATTDYDYSDSEVNITNQLYLLDATDDELSVVSILENLGKPNERIYAVRFQGDIGYVVTFVNTDPLYKLDLSDPENPEILGELYEEGVSDYLHMITEDLMLGVGRNAETIDGITRFTGVKISLYDVSENEPVSLQTILVGDGYTYTNVIYNHKLFVMYEPTDEDYVYVAIPISGYSDSFSKYYQGIYIYEVNYNGTMNYVTDLSHLSSEYDYFDTIEKAVFIDNFIYTISYSKIIKYDTENNFEILNETILNERYYENKD